jgi:crotonobetainyl-CoA:carnitine CoA-transferase CaiB-like acyl-CoA transferase
MPGSLSHIRVLDLSRVLAGPWVGQTLGDLGADVIKIERPQGGDDTRSWGPPFLKTDAGVPTGEAAYFLSANRNKKSVTIDFAQSEGADIVRALVEKADVFIENFKVDGLKQYGLDAEALRALNPRLIYCSITGFGQTGPYRERAGYDFLIQGMGGLMSITGRKDGEPGAGPQKVGVALTDIMTGLYATNAILAALIHRERSGEGQSIDIALLDVQVAALANQSMNYLTSGSTPVRLGNAHPNIVPYQDFPTADGSMIVTVGNEGQFERLCAALEQPTWYKDERFRTNERRVVNREALIMLISERTLTQTTAHWVRALEAVGVPCGPINTIAEAFADPQIVAREMTFTMRHDAGAEVNLVANPIRMSATPPTYRLPPPVLGHDTDAVLSEALKMDPETIADLAARKII